MANLLEEPWQLSSYAAISDTTLVFPAAVTPAAYSTWSKGKQKADEPEIAVFTVQGDGVHLVEVSEQTPLETFTLGPSVRFTTAAVARSTRRSTTQDVEDASATKRVRRTFVGVEAEGGAGEVWCWTSEERKDGAVEGETVKTVHKTSSRVIDLQAPAGSDHVFCADQRGQMVCLDQDLAVVAVLEGAESSAPGQILRLQAFDATPSPLLPSRSPSDTLHCLTRLVLTASPEKLKGKKRRSDAHAAASAFSAVVEVISATFDVEAPRLTRVASLELPDKDVLDISVHPSGSVSVLTASSGLITYRLVSTNASHFSLQFLKTLTLTGLFFSPASSLHRHLFHVGESFLLLAGPPTANADRLAVLLCDTQHGVALSDQEITLSNGLEGRKDVSFSLQRLGPSTLAVLVSAPGAQTVAYAVPATIPAASSLATALGRQDLTRRFVITSEPRQETSTLLRNPLMGDQRWTHLQAGEQKRNDALARILAALEERRNAAEADARFEAWYADEKERLAAFAQETRERKQTLPNGHAETEVDGAPKVDVVNGINGVKGKKKRKAKTKKQNPEPSLPSDFVSAIVNALLAIDSSSLALLHRLLPRNVVFHHAVRGGLITPLLKHNDWAGLLLILRHVSDLPESDLADLLAAATSVPRQGDIQPQDGANPLPLAYWVSRIANYPTSLVPLRSALRSKLSLDQVGLVLDVLADWLRYWKGESSPSQGEAPSLLATVRFAQALLDAHFVTLLSDTTLHDRVEALTNTLRELVVISTDLQTLREPLAPYVRATKRDKMVEEPEVDRRSIQERRRAARIEALAQSMAVGDYVVEEFDL